MKTIHKYPISMEGTRVQLPKDAQIVKVDMQPGVGPCFWALVDTDNPEEERAFVALGTGHAFLYGMGYMGTWQEPPFVWHLFEVTHMLYLKK